jgi:3-hydroxybutyryl-CoA dehydrogenase
MGLGVAECFAAAGVEVRLVDATPELTLRARERLVERARGHAEAGLLSGEAVERVADVETADDVSKAVRGVDLVFEAVPENVELAGFVRGPGRFLGMHWFNPPEWTPGVEVIPAADTEPEVIERVMAFLREIGKRPAVVGDGPGFVANRIQNALFLEALRCVEEGLASPQEVDEVVRSTFGFRLPFFGPFQIADMAGLDVYASVLRTLKDGLGERFETPDVLRELVEEGRTGTKSGAGFLEYTDEERKRLLLERDRRYAALNELLEKLPPVEAGRSGGEA